MKKKDKELLIEVRRLLQILMIKVEEASHLEGLGFDKTKSLNILFKELQAQKFVLRIILGEANPKKLASDLNHKPDFFDIPLPLSVKYAIRSHGGRLEAQCRRSRANWRVR